MCLGGVLMEDMPIMYVWGMNIALIAIGIFFFYLIYRFHPCWKFFLFLHGLFTLDAYYIEHFPFSFSFALIAFSIFMMSLVYLRGETGERLNRLIDEKLVKRFFCKN